MPDVTQAHLAVINEAYLLLGGEALQSFDDDEDARRAYTTTVGAALGHLAFPFSVERVQLVRISGEADSGYTYNFRSPVAGDIAAIYRDAETQEPFHDFRVLDGKVNTDLEEAWAEIIGGSSPDDWPEYVRQAVIACIMADHCVSISGDSREADRLSRRAYGVPGVDFPNGGLLGAARSRASQQQGGGQITLGPDPLTSARYR
jgi:hypothetical protein